MVGPWSWVRASGRATGRSNSRARLRRKCHNRSCSTRTGSTRTPAASRTSRRRGQPTVLTPHAGELGRLLDVESGAVGAKRLEHAREAAKRATGIVVLKGDDTLVADADGRVAVSPGGVPALATAGTGDVLSGVIAALLAKELDPFDAAAIGVLSHLHAGAAAAQRRSPDAVIASDVIEALGRPR